MREESSVSTNLDPRWLDLAVRLGRSDLVQVLAVPGHAGASEFLATLFRQGLGKAGKEYELSGVLDTMIRVGHPGATDAVIELIKKFARGEIYVRVLRAFLLGRPPDPGVAPGRGPPEAGSAPAHAAGEDDRPVAGLRDRAEAGHADRDLHLTRDAPWPRPTPRPPTTPRATATSCGRRRRSCMRRKSRR